MFSRPSEKFRKREVRLDPPKIRLSLSTRGFTIIELLVTISIVVILTSIMMPGFRAARESANRIQCSSNLRQIGLAMYYYASQNGEHLPSTVFDDADSSMPGEMMALTTGSMTNSDLSGQWDGLGLLIGDANMFLDSARVLYCPCHHGSHHFSSQTGQLQAFAPTRIYGNYHFIGDTDRANNHQRLLFEQTSSDVIVADGMREASDINHVNGTNTLRGDVSVRFWYDRSMSLRNAFANSTLDDPPTEETYNNLWILFGKPGN